MLQRRRRHEVYPAPTSEGKQLPTRPSQPDTDTVTVRRLLLLLLPLTAQAQHEPAPSLEALFSFVHLDPATRKVRRRLKRSDAKHTHTHTHTDIHTFSFAFLVLFNIGTRALVGYCLLAYGGAQCRRPPTGRPLQFQCSSVLPASRCSLSTEAGIGRAV